MSAKTLLTIYCIKWKEENKVRPLKLVMNAFGPYKEKVVIDFTQFQQETLFLVSGPTGAGKTTIFDAIAYALYDDASGTSRGKDSFKSQFASDDILCFVELEFEIAGKKYFIKRSPAQKGPGKNGKLKNWSSEVEFHHNGTVTTKINEANKEIQELLSLSYEQFKQIVMLPQGEFKKMLESNSADKEKIFRNIFQTDTIKEFQSILKDQANNLKREIDQSENTLQQFVGMINKDVNETLKEAIAFFDVPTILKELTTLVEDYQTKIGTLENELSALNGKYQTNQQKIEWLTRLEFLEQEKNSLESTKELIEAKRIEIELAKKAETCLEAKKQVESLTQQRMSIEKELLEEQKQLVDISEQFIEAKNRYEILQTEYKDLPAKRESLTDLKEQEKQLNEQVTKEQAKVSLENENEETQQLIVLLTDQVIRENEQLDKIDYELKEIQLAKVSIMDKQREAARLQQEEHQQIKEQEAVIDFCENLEKQTVKVEAFQEIEYVFTQIEKKYQEKRVVYNRNLAGILAEELAENEACPVCGSLHHPSPAKLANDTISKEALETLEVEKNELGKQFDRLSIELQGLNEVIQTSEEKLSIQRSEVYEKRAKLDELMSEDRIKQDRITKEIAALQKIMDKEEQVEEQKQEILQQIREKESKIQVLRSTIQHNVKRIDELKKDIDTLKIRTKSSSLSEIQAQIDNRIKEITTIEQEYEEAQEQKSTLERQQTQYQTSTTSFEKQLSLLLEREADLKELFHQQLKINQLDDTFEKYVVKKELKEQMIEEIESFDKKSWANQDAILEQKRKLEKEGSSHSIEVYQSHNQEIENHSRTLKTQQHELIGTEKTVQSILSQIQLNYQTKKGQQEEYLMYKELAEIANGSKETDYISFERYVLGIYFEEIIEAANSRFTQMTNSRYSLIRNKEKTKGAGPKGLDLDVFDNYTGMKRSVKTLSGGESFKASLALALGLSDVIQNHSGGVSVDTLFIDEGFGTLDTDSLDSAIETLVELNQRGRLVGIISHVEELKTRIPVHIKVTKSSKGSYAEIKV